MNFLRNIFTEFC